MPLRSTKLTGLSIARLNQQRDWSARHTSEEIQLWSSIGCRADRSVASATRKQERRMHNESRSYPNAPSKDRRWTRPCAGLLKVCPMRVLIVHAHHEPQSFNGAMTREAKAALIATGNEVVVSDLYAMQFDPISDRRNFVTVKKRGYRCTDAFFMTGASVGGEDASGARLLPFRERRAARALPRTSFSLAAQRRRTR